MNLKGGQIMAHKLKEKAKKTKGKCEDSKEEKEEKGKKKEWFKK